MAATHVHVALDPGSDTIKIAYAYTTDGKEKVGKIVGDPLGMTAIPAVAYYDVEENEWLYGDEVNSVGDKPFITVVKIRDLLRLLEPAASDEVRAVNRKYYFDYAEFPKFYFPVREVLTADMDRAHRLDRTFVCDESPSDICERFFEYVHDVIIRRLDILFDGEEYDVIPCLVYPQFADGEYKLELKRLVERAFGRSLSMYQSMAKALCAYARYSGKLVSGERAIIFNIGEERTSLVKVSFNGGGISVDGVDGHNPPIALGGKDIDDTVAQFIDETMARRETMGRPSAGEAGHIAESALNTKQYLFVKDIKSAKIILGMPIYESRAFRSGVPISAARDLLIQRYITREQFCGCLGIKSNIGFARDLADYIKSELMRPINADTKSIFLTGGPVETYGLVDYIRAQMAPLGVSVGTFETELDARNNDDGFDILAHEDALYSPAIGCAVSSLYGLTVDTVIALTYGVRLFRTAETGKSVPFFKVLVDKQTKIPTTGIVYSVPKDTDKHGITTGTDSSESAPMHIMSTFFSAEDIRHCRKAPTITYFNSRGENLLVVDTENKTLLKKLESNVGLRILNGSIENMDVGAKAKYFYKGICVKVFQEVYLSIGVDIDGDGFARAFASNDRRRNARQYTVVEYLEPGRIDGVFKQAGSRETVFKKDIDFKFELETQLT